LKLTKFIGIAFGVMKEPPPFTLVECFKENLVIEVSGDVTEFKPIPLYFKEIMYDITKEKL